MCRRAYERTVFKQFFIAAYKVVTTRYISHPVVFCEQGKKPFSLHKTVFFFIIIISIKFLFIKVFLPTAINCTSLTVNPSGLLRMSSCGNHYGSKCNFSCTIGHHLNGSSTVTCVAPGNQHPGIWNKAIPTCEGKSL